MDGSAPFRELSEFKNTCFRSFPVSQTHRMNLSEVLKLYTCAYQPQAVWKDLWKMQLSLMSPHIAKDCEAFVQRVPFVEEEFVGLMRGSF